MSKDKTVPVSTNPMYQNPVVTTPGKRNDGKVREVNKGIPVGEGCNMQDVPREVRIHHMRTLEQSWKQKFSQKYSGGHGGQLGFGQ